MAAKRLIKELDAYSRDGSSAISLLEAVDDEDLFHLTAILRGPEETAYEGNKQFKLRNAQQMLTNSIAGGRFRLSISVPQNYPASPPDIRFQTPCCHPNVNFKTGEICLDLFKGSWTPAYGLASALEAIQQLLSTGGEPDNPFNTDIARLFREGDYVAAEGLVRFYTGLYATSRG